MQTRYSRQTHQNVPFIVHANISATICRSGLGGSVGVGSSIGPCNTCLACRPPVVGHLSVKFISGFWLGATGVTTATAATSTSSASTSSLSVAGRLCNSGRLGLTLGLSADLLDAGIVDNGMVFAYATRSLRAFAGTGGGARAASRTIST